MGLICTKFHLLNEKTENGSPDHGAKEEKQQEEVDQIPT